MSAERPMMPEGAGGATVATGYNLENEIVVALSNKRVNPACVACGRAKTWDDWEIVAVPSAVGLFNVEPVVCAALFCSTCGFLRQHSLALLDVKKPETSRIIKLT